jgi:hypothetical protein
MRGILVMVLGGEILTRITRFKYLDNKLNFDRREWLHGSSQGLLWFVWSHLCFFT